MMSVTLGQNVIIHVINNDGVEPMVSTYSITSIME